MKSSIRHKLERIEERFSEVTALLAEPEIQNDQNRFRALGQEYAQLEPVVATWREYVALEETAEAAEAMLEDPEMAELAREELTDAEAQREALEPKLQLLLVPPDPNDQRNVFLEVRAGTGGAEAALFAGDLLRMYLRYAEARGWRTETMSETEGEMGGYKEVVVRITGNDVYSRLKFEPGAHRVQRVPETESQGRIHTSACTVAVLAEVQSVDAVDINPADLRTDTYRASGAGGQHVNKTDSAVRLTHLPTGIVVQCQNDRSQHKNRDQAWKQLKAKLYELEMQKRSESAQALEDTKSDIGWGSQIRSYVLDQSRIKDLRTNVETGNTQAVLDGGLDMFIEASLKSGL